jgi:hypothetical protein
MWGSSDELARFKSILDAIVEKNSKKVDITILEQELNSDFMKDLVESDNRLFALFLLAFLNNQIEMQTIIKLKYFSEELDYCKDNKYYNGRILDKFIDRPVDKSKFTTKTVTNLISILENLASADSFSCKNMLDIIETYTPIQIYELAARAKHYRGSDNLENGFILPKNPITNTYVEEEISAYQFPLRDHEFCGKEKFIPKSGAITDKNITDEAA